MLSNKLIDTHAHLLDKSFDSDRDNVLREISSGKISKIVEVSDAVDDWDEAFNFARSVDFVWLALGEHPHNADKFCASERINEFRDKFLELKENSKIVAVGEIGLDYCRNYSDPKNQRKAFAKQLDFWRNTGKPVIVHCRQAESDMYAMLKDFASGFRSKTGVLHCFSGSADFAQKVIELGFFIGVDGPVTYRKNDALRDIVKDAGLDNILLETDSPYLAPEPVRGSRNTPEYLAHIVRELAGMFNVDPDKVAEAANRNAKELFRF